MRLPWRRTARPNTDQLTMMEHLWELRRRTIISVVGITIGAAIGYAIYPEVLSFLMHPLCVTNGRGHCGLYVTGPFDGFAVRVKVAAVTGVFLASPLILWELWRFISPGLRSVERRYGFGFVASSLTLFMAGAGIAYVVFPRVLNFLQSASGANVHDIYTPQSYLNFLLLLMVAFGVAFLFPLVLLAVELVGIVTPETLAKKRRFAWFAIIVVVAVFIPSSDPYSLTALTIPLLLFYELSIVVGKLLLRRRRREAAVTE
ncbi:MAG: twin-arginine translocase subunit TatC [Ferrimicrobium sp.]